MPAARDPVVSVIVVCSGHSEDLRRCLQALLGAGDPAPEVIVVHTGADDDAAGVAAAFREVKLVRSPPHLGLAAGDNLGLAHATGEYVALVTEDTVVAPDWIRGLVRFLEAHPDAAAAGGKTYDWSDQHPVGDRRNPSSSHVTIDPATCHARTLRNRPDEVREVATLPGWALMLRRRALDQVGPLVLEPDFATGYEETDLCARLLVQGWRIYATGSPAAWHRVGGADPDRRRRQAFYLHRNRTLFAYRNLGPAGLRTLLRRQRFQDLVDRLRLRLDRLWPADEQVRARREAQRWIDDHRALLERHRAGSGHARDERWAAAVRLAQAGGGVPDLATRPPPSPGRAGPSPASRPS